MRLGTDTDVKKNKQLSKDCPIMLKRQKVTEWRADQPIKQPTDKCKAAKAGKKLKIAYKGKCKAIGMVIYKIHMAW